MPRPKRYTAKGPSPQNSPNREISTKEWELLGSLDRIARRKKLEEFGHFGSPAESMKAIGMLEDLDRITSTGLGPKVPLTEAEKIDRMSRLMCAMGETLTLASLKVAKKYWKEEATWVAPTLYDGESKAVEGEKPERPTASDSGLE